MNPMLLLPAIAIAAAIFCAFAWVASRAIRTTGRARFAHIAAALLTIAAMATITAAWPNAAILIGALLVAAGLCGAVVETGSARLWPLVLALFGGVCVAGIPFE